MSSPKATDARPVIIGTAGHIDHGKTVLVEALTGIATDRLPEEKRRGISIDLGFAPLDLGPDAPAASFVDVPGHEAFIKNTLGIERAVVAITKSDLVDAEWCDLVVETTTDMLAGTRLEGAETVIVSARAGDGIDRLRTTLAGVAMDVSDARTDRPTRLPVDRSFPVVGVGTVVTGTLWAGTIAQGDTLRTLPEGDTVRVRSIEVHGSSVEQARSGQRTALALTGSGTQSIRRGTTLVEPDAGWRSNRRADVRLWLVTSAPRPVEAGDRLRFHHGTTEVMGRVRWYSSRRVEPGEEGYGRVRFEKPLVIASGDRMVVRAYSPVETIGGAEIVLRSPPRVRARERDDHATRLAEIVRAKPQERVSQILEMAGGRGVADTSLVLDSGMGSDQLESALAAIPESVARYGERWFAQNAVDAAAQQLINAVDLYHRRQPLQPGMGLEAARQAVSGSDPALIEAVIGTLVDDGQLERRGAAVAIAGHEVELGEEEERLVESIRDGYREAGLEAPDTIPFANQLGIDEQQLRELQHYLERRGELAKLASDWYIDGSALERARVALVERLEADGAVDTGTCKAVLGVSRKFLIPVLEYFDRSGVTRREGNKRVLVKPMP
ncbi:MAG: SelB C-terminal domain-containing protein [Gemmatimonadota bacterium]